MYGLSLCSGIGGIDLGLHLAIPGYRTICYVEKEAYCQDILLARMADGVLDRAPIWGDIARFDVRPWCGLVDVVHGGYPCQPFSVAGKRAGADDERHLWPHVARIVAECQPTYGFFENVGGHLSLGFREVARDLEGMGYCVSAGLFTAAEVGAPHRRQRLFILAHHQGQRGRTRWSERTGRERIGQPDERNGQVGHPDDPRLEGRREPEREGPDEWSAWPPGPEERDRWERVATAFEPAICGVAHGLPNRVDRLKALGNAVVPDVAALAWRMLRAQLDQA